MKEETKQDSNDGSRQLKLDDIGFENGSHLKRSPQQWTTIQIRIHFILSLPLSTWKERSEDTQIYIITMEELYRILDEV